MLGHLFFSSSIVATIVSLIDTEIADSLVSIFMLLLERDAIMLHDMKVETDLLNNEVQAAKLESMDDRERSLSHVVSFLLLFFS